MVGAEHEVGAAGGDEGASGLCVFAPEHEDARAGLGGQVGDEGVGKVFPALANVAGGLALFDGEAGVEQQGAALGPGQQAAVWGGGQGECNYLLRRV